MRFKQIFVVGIRASIIDGYWLSAGSSQILVALSIVSAPLVFLSL
jgi:hypothetical protein